MTHLPQSPFRLAMILGVFVLWGAAIVGRLVQLQIRDHEQYVDAARQRQQTEVQLHSPRGTIYDARKRSLAVSAAVRSAWAVPAGCSLCPDGSDRVTDAAATAKAAGRLLRADERKLQSRLGGPGEFVWVSRKLSPEAAAGLEALALPGVEFLWESQRFYPQGSLAAGVLGFVGMDDKGLEGLEQRFENVVAGRPVSRKMLRDARAGKWFHPTLSISEAEPGLDLFLTLDANIQYLAERELEAAMERHAARSGSVILLDPRNGAILAMASAPGFDPNRFDDFDRSRWKNRAVADTFEPGSTMKLFTAAAVLEANLADPDDLIDCQEGRISVDGVVIRDHHSFPVITFREVISRSSNVGAVKLGLLAGRARLLDTFQAFGFGQRSGVDLPGEAAGSMLPMETGMPRAEAYAAFGHGMTSTALQIVNAFAAIANGGTLYRPFIVHGVGRDGALEQVLSRPVELARPISSHTARTLERLLETTVEEGTGKKARVRGYRVAGKTGTAQKLIDGRFSRTKYVASFVGFAPARDPVVVGVVVIDEPSRGLTDGGDVAAPVFKAVVEPALVYMGVEPDLPLDDPSEGVLVAAAPAEQRETASVEQGILR